MNRGLWRAALVGWMAASLIVSPVFAQAGASGAPQTGSTPSQNPFHVQPAEPQVQASQDQSQTQSQSTTQQQGQSTTPPQPVPPTQVPESQASTAVGPIAPKSLPLGHQYAKGKPLFPNPFAAYSPIKVGEPTLTNTPKIDQLVQDGKLMLSLDDAISLALENNLDIRVQRYNAWIVDTGLLKAQAGGIPQTASAQQVVLGLPPVVSFDPVLSTGSGNPSGVNWSRQAFPVNNIFTSGFAAAAPEFILYSANYDFGYTQGFHTGTSISVQWQNNRGSTNSPGYIFNPFVQSTLSVGFSQPLLNGCCRLPNTRYIIEAKNNQKIATAQFKQFVIADITTTADDYWELVYDREAVKVQEQAVGVSQKLYEDNKKRLEIGTMAPLDVITAESQLATDKQALVAAQTAVLLQEAKLLSDITKDPLASNLASIDIVPTTPISTPEVVENVPLDTLMAEAWQNRPEMTQARLTLVNDKLEVKGTRNALLPSLNLTGQYVGTGLAGFNTTASLATTPAAVAADILNEQASAAVLGPQVFPTLPIAAATSSNAGASSGLGTALRNMINASSPTYFGGVTFSMTIRNRSAQADSAHAMLSERQEEVTLRQLQNTIFVNVRQAQVSLEQDRANVAAAAEATKLAQQTLDAEQKKYQLGSSTSYTVVQRARDLTAAQGTEIRARVNLIEAEILFNQAMGRTIDANKITLADAFQGKVSRNPNIPGALDADDPAERPDTWSPGKK